MPTADAEFVQNFLAESVTALATFQADAAYRHVMAEMAESIVMAMRDGKKLLIAGNGGSAGDAQHIAGEFIARLMYDRAPLAAIALTTDTSVITATGNDYGYDHIFSRQVFGLGQPGDVFLGISTSGKSPNVLRAFAAAQERGLVSIGFAGADGGPMREACSHILQAPSGKTAIVQQIHIVAAHIICGLVERTMFPRNSG
jgi:D-sedoheptulose 7-phosphate isomerase